MQPYLFPYVGYFQLMAAVDQFVYLDDVASTRPSWVNRNRWLTNGVATYFTAPVRASSLNTPIYQLRLVSDSHWREKLLIGLRHRYRRAPHFLTVSRIFEEVISTQLTSAAQLAINSIEVVCRHLDINVPTSRSIDRWGASPLTKSARIFDMCKKVGADEYVNPAGGRALYCEAAFREHGIRLEWLLPRIAPYHQIMATSFVPSLSIVDVMMFNSVDRVRDMVRPANL
jgi:hypothetical protein